MAPTAGGLEPGGMAWEGDCKVTIKMADSTKTKIVKCADNWLKKKKGREKGDKYYLEGYLEDPRILLDDDICLVKAKCYRSMLKNEKPHDLKIIIDITGHSCSVITTSCSCKAGKGKCQHISALFTHLKAKLEDNESPTSRLQQWHRPRGSNIAAQRWFNSEFAKPRINRKNEQTIQRKVNNYLYDPRPASERHVSIETIKELGENISINSPTTYASWLQYINTKDDERGSLPWANPLKGSTISHQLQDIYPEGMLKTVYTNDKLEHVFQFPTDIPLSKPFKEVDLLEQEELLLQSVKLTTEKSKDIEKNTRSQSESNVWYQERSHRITASKFGDVMRRKAPVNNTFLKSLFGISNVQTEYMRYGIQKEPQVVKDFKERSGSDVKVFKCGLLVNPKLYWMGASPDGIIYDPQEDPQVGILEVKCIPSVNGKSIKESIELKKDLCLTEVDDIITLKRNHKYYYQIQGVMGIAGLTWCKLCVHTKDGAENLFIEKINFDNNLFQEMISKIQELYFVHSLPYLCTR